ncbi:MAG: SRPBCC family protein [Acidimicrobiia bacterium]
MAAPFRFDRSWTFPVSPAELWAVLERTDDYVGWWSWLREFDVDGLRPGGRAACTIQSPLPYALRCDIRVLDVVPRSSIVTQVGGDLHGPARLDLAASDGGVSARLSWTLELANPVLAGLARVGRPVMAWAHDVVVAAGVEQFRRRALPPGRGDMLAS